MTAPAPLRTGGQQRRVGRVDLALMSLYWIAIGYLWSSLGSVILPDLVKELVGPAHKGTALSLLEGLGTVLAVVWQPMAGAISDRTRSRFGRRRPFIVGGTIGDVIFLVGIALSGSYGVLIVFYFLLQAASNTAQGPYQGLLPDAVPEDQRGDASGFYGLGNLLGTLAGVVGGGLLLTNYGRIPAIASIAILLLLTMVVTVTRVPDVAPPVHEQFSSPLQAFRHTFTLDLRRDRDFAWLMASRLLILMGIVGLQTFALFYLADVFFAHDRHGARIATIIMLGGVVVAALLVTWPAARLSDRFGRRPLILGGGLLAALGGLILVFSHYQMVPTQVLQPIAELAHIPLLAGQALIAGLIIGVGFGCFLSVDWAYMTEVIPPLEAGRFMGVSNIATAGSGAIARLAAGPVLDSFYGRQPVLGLPNGYAVLFSVFVAWMVIGSFLVLKVRESGKMIRK